jgi:aldehyde:ferredoxin oxidoreductase
MADYGYAGEILKINLTDGKTARLQTGDYAGRFLGGRGIGAKIFWDEAPAGIRAFDPQNPLIFVTGPVAGFTRLAGCRMQICGKSPLMDPESFSYANLGGSWGAWHKFAGYDGLVVTGKADRPVYLYLDDRGKIEVREASHLWGKNTVETQNILHNELGNEVKVLGIGPAAENKVYFALAMASENSFFGGGLASVMGSKNLKAIVVNVKERKSPRAAEPDKLNALAKQAFDLYTRNWEDGRQKTLTGKITACYGCLKGCSRRSYEAENGQKFRSYCQSTMVYLMPAMQYSSQDGIEVSRLATRLCDKYGLDSMVMQPLIDWLILAYKAGILSESETGLPFSRAGSAEFMETLVQKIAYRDGIGDILAQGIVRAAAQIGKGSQNLLSAAGVATRTGEKQDYDARLMTANALIYATEPRKPIQLLHGIAAPLRRWVNWLDKLEGAYLSSAVFQDIARRHWGGADAGDLTTLKGKPLAAKMIQDYGYAKESLILCDATWPIIQVNSIDDSLGCGTLESRIVSAITGRDLDETALLRIGERAFNLQRSILLRDSWGGRQGDILLDYLHEEPLQSVYWSAECLAPDKEGKAVSCKGARLSRSDFEKMKSEYYSLRGWDVESGLPTEAKLHQLDLDDIAALLDKIHVLVRE